MVQLDKSYDCNSVIPLEFEIGNLFYERKEIHYRKIEVNKSKPRGCTYDIIIIGAGLSACFIACQIRSLFPTLKILMIDENEYFIESFWRRTYQIRQKTLRSPYTHQIAPDRFIQLIDYARLHHEHLTDRERKQIELARAGQRSIVPLDLFLKHTFHVIRAFGLKYASYKSQVHAIKKVNSMFRVCTGDGIEFKARVVISATGHEYQCEKEKNPNIFDCFQYVNNEKLISKGDKILVSGSGLSAGYIIYDLVKKGHKPYWAIGNNIRIRCSDVPTNFFREEGFNFFNSMSIEDKILIIKAENKASLMPEFESFLLEVIRSGTLTLSNKFPIQNVFNKVITCHGLPPRNELIADNKMKYGFPAISEDLELEDGHFVIGINATMVLGVAAKNIDGFRLASERILPKISETFNRRIERQSYKRIITGKRAVV